MNTKLLKDVWHSPCDDGSTLLVLMALADEANEHGEYTAEMPTIARKARQSERNCRYILRRLESLQIIECLQANGRGHKNSYRISTQNLQRLQTLQTLQPLPPFETLQPLPPLRQSQQEQEVTASENAETLQPLPPLVNTANPANPANPATIAPFAGFVTPSPLHSPTLDIQDKEQDLSPKAPLPAETAPAEMSNNGPPPPAPPPKRSRKPPRLDMNYTPGFSKWWAVYPPDRRTDKPQCFAKWQEYNLEPRTEELVAKIERLKNTTWNRPRAERGFIKSSLPYLNGGRFEDELVPLDGTTTLAKERTPL
jgi:hypothetical protein